MRRIGGLIAIAALGTGCIPVMTPPLKGDLGYAARLGGDTGYRFSAGTDVASLVPDPDFPLMAGGGYVQTSTKYGDDRTPVHGLYLEGGPRIAGGQFWRVFAVPRAEVYFAPRGPDPAFAGIVRVQAEIFSPTVGDHMSSTSSGATAWWGVAFGIFGVGAYLEGGYQHLPNDAAYPLLGAGLTLRVPATAGLVCCAWDFAHK